MPANVLCHKKSFNYEAIQTVLLYSNRAVCRDGSCPGRTSIYKKYIIYKEWVHSLLFSKTFQLTGNALLHGILSNFSMLILSHHSSDRKIKMLVFYLKLAVKERIWKYFDFALNALNTKIS